MSINDRVSISLSTSQPPISINCCYVYYDLNQPPVVSRSNVGSSTSLTILVGGTFFKIFFKNSLQSPIANHIYRFDYLDYPWSKFHHLFASDIPRQCSKYRRCKNNKFPKYLQDKSINDLLNFPIFPKTDNPPPIIPCPSIPVIHKQRRSNKYKLNRYMVILWSCLVSLSRLPWEIYGVSTNWLLKSMYSRV